MPSCRVGWGSNMARCQRVDRNEMGCVCVCGPARVLKEVKQGLSKACGGGKGLKGDLSKVLQKGMEVLWDG